MAVLSVFSVVTFLCGAHNSTKRRARRVARAASSGDKKLVSRMQSSISSKALLMVKIISRRKVQNDEEEAEELDDDDEAVWKRTIIMGEKCRPLDFSGQISYDCHGNLLPSSPRHDQSHKRMS
ncbi:hypothetical protein U1Q18_012082 [Sarracenia purpurea var. burkii]